MSFWDKSKWLSEGSSDFPPVEPWEESKVEAAGYRLSVGSEYFVNGTETSTVMQLENKQGFIVGPGQFAFILTKEVVRIPTDMIGFISIRASTKFMGLVNVSGFQVNPGFRGNLIFAVFNAGPKHINLRESDEIFSIWIANLISKAPNHEAGGNIPNDLSSIPSSVLNSIAGKSLTAYQVSEQLTNLDSTVGKLSKELDKAKLNILYGKIILGILFIVAMAFFGPAVKEWIFEFKERSSASVETDRELTSQTFYEDKLNTQLFFTDDE